MNRISFANNKGVVLVTSLMMTFISLTIVMAVMYMITQNVQKTGGFKRYKSALEASYGGTEAVVKQIMPVILNSSFSGGSTDFTLFSVSYPNNSDCSIATKLTSSPNAWAASCDRSQNPKAAPDITFQLPASIGAQSYTVYAKIIDTVAGNTDQSGGEEVITGGVVEAFTGSNEVKHLPYVYRLEIQAERSTNATEHASLSVLYAY